MLEFINPYYFAPIAAFLLVFLLGMPARKGAAYIGLLDRPDSRKKHQKPIPPIGGLVIFPIFMAVGQVAGLDLMFYWPFYVSLIILLAAGALDDFFSLNAWVKFAAHLAVAMIVVFLGNSQVAYLGDLFGFGIVWASIMSYPFSIIAVVLLINAVNLMDGLDGLAGGKSVVMFCWLLVGAAAQGYHAQTLALLILIGAIGGFLVFNMRSPWRRSASMFLGDSGSMCLGLSLAWFSIHLAKGGGYPLEPMTVAWILGLPIFDACAQFYRRVQEGKDPFAPDRGHIHHHFIDAGFSAGWATVMIMAIIFLMGGVGVVGPWVGVPVWVLTLLWIVCFVFHIALSRYPARYVHMLTSLYQLRRRV